MHILLVGKSLQRPSKVTVAVMTTLSDCLGRELGAAYISRTRSGREIEMHMSTSGFGNLAQTVRREGSRVDVEPNSGLSCHISQVYQRFNGKARQLHTSAGLEDLLYVAR